MELYYHTDTVMQYDDMTECPRLPTSQIRELQQQHNCNISGEEDSWFDEDFIPEHISIVTEEELFSDLFL